MRVHVEFLCINPFMEIISEKLEKQFQKFLCAAVQYFSQLLLKARLLGFLSTGRTLKNC